LGKIFLSIHCSRTEYPRQSTKTLIIYIILRYNVRLLHRNSCGYFRLSLKNSNPRLDMESPKVSHPSVKGRAVLCRQIAVTSQLEVSYEYVRTKGIWTRVLYNVLVDVLVYKGRSPPLDESSRPRFSSSLLRTKISKQKIL